VKDNLEALTRYEGCGHVGYVTGKKEKAFIQLAEIRNRPLLESPKQCPDCRKGGD
jgi:hypothetical protein